MVTISLHFRFGDYKNYPDIYPLLDYKYYSDSLSYIINQLDMKIKKLPYYIFVKMTVYYNQKQ